MNFCKNRKSCTGNELVDDGIDKPRGKCGIFGIYGHPEAARLTYFGFYALQHRGQESCGIVAGGPPEFAQLDLNDLVQSLIPWFLVRQLSTTST